MLILTEIIARKLAARRMGLRLDIEGARLPENLWAQAKPDAEALITVIRRPTPEMIEAGARIICSESGGGGWDAIDQLTRNWWMKCFLLAWQAACDAEPT